MFMKDTKHLQIFFFYFHYKIHISVHWNYYFVLFLLNVSKHFWTALYCLKNRITLNYSKLIPVKRIVNLWCSIMVSDLSYQSFVYSPKTEFFPLCSGLLLDPHQILAAAVMMKHQSLSKTILSIIYV